MILELPSQTIRNVFIPCCQTEKIFQVESWSSRSTVAFRHGIRTGPDNLM